MSCQVLFINEQVMVPIQLPKLAVNHVEMLVAEILSDLINVLLLLQKLDDGEQVGSPQFGYRNFR